VEVTKPSEPSMEGVALGDSASKQAVTRVNAEQASKRVTWMPTRPFYGEGRRCGTLESDNPPQIHRGSGDGMLARGDQRNTGSLPRRRRVTANSTAREGRVGAGGRRRRGS
jgi:hypothetical protein